jgi:hypothetical protein
MAFWNKDDNDGEGAMHVTDEEWVRMTGTCPNHNYYSRRCRLCKIADEVTRANS